MRRSSSSKWILYDTVQIILWRVDETNEPPGKYVSSSDLVPGDIYELSDPNLTQFPSDGLLLTGDCIVNESMLTGKKRKSLLV